MKSKPAAINAVWFFLIIISILVAAYSGTMDAVAKASFDAAKNAVTLALSLVGAMALWLGIMKVAEEAGLTLIISRAIRPVMTRLFPDVPAEHPAMSAMIMNMAANMLGLGNAATPFGIKAMTELDTLNGEKGAASDAMCLFLAINTSSVTLLPLGVIAVRSAAGSSHAAGILLPGLFATLCSTGAGIVAAKIMARRKKIASCTPLFIADGEKPVNTTAIVPRSTESNLLGKIILWGILIAILGAIPYRYFVVGAMPHLSLELVTTMTEWLIPLLMGGLLLFGYYRGVCVYEAVTEGAKEGFQVAVRIIPFMVAVFVAIGMFRESGALTLLGTCIAPITGFLGLPIDVLPLALLRPLSGTGSFAVMSEIVNSAPDSFAAFTASIMQGSTETTFYVLTVYFGAVGIRRIRYALHAALIADAVGISAAVVMSHVFYRLLG